jgi:hypothetical protein
VERGLKSHHDHNPLYLLARRVNRDGASNPQNQQERLKLMTRTPIENGMLQLYSCVDTKTIERVRVFLAGFKPEWNGECICVIDWKINHEDKTGRLTYQTRNDLCAPVYDQDFPMIVTREPLQKPNRSNNWEWNEYLGEWRNRRTGERVRVY